jgi:hypothetical protein
MCLALPSPRNHLRAWAASRPVGGSPPPGSVMNSKWCGGMGRFRTRCRELDEGFGLIHRMAYYAHSRPGCGHFFARKDQMDYPVKAQRDDTLLQMLGENGMAVTDARRAGG